MMNAVVKVGLSVMGFVIVSMMWFSFVYMYVMTSTMLAIIGG